MQRKKLCVTTLFFGPVILLVLLAICNKFNVRFFYVLTGSMGRAVPAGSVIITTDMSPEKIRLGAIIVHQDLVYHRITAHRIIAIKEDSYITKGDLNSYADRLPVKPSSIVGVVVGVIPIESYSVIIVQVVFLVIVYVLGVLMYRFLLFLRYGISCPV